MSYGDDNESASDHDFGDLFGSEDEASDIDDGRSQSSVEENNPSPVAAASPPPPAPAPAQQPTNKSNDLDNLFGSDDESESDEEDKRQTLKQRSRLESSEDEDTRSPARYEEEEREEYDEYDDQINKKQRVEVSLEMPQLPVPYSDNNKYYLAKLPRFLDIEVNPFVPSEFEVQIEEGLTAVQEQEAIREQIESMIRWRRVRKNGMETMESNAHIVEWEDGRKSLMLGDECFDIGTKPIGVDDHSFLLAHQTGSGALESQTEFTDLMAFMPSGLTSDTHRNLTAQIADKQVKKNRTKMFFTEKDPELMKQELESQENERLKAQKKLELQRRKVDMRYGDATSSRRNHDFGDYDTADYPSRNAAGSQAQDRYEDDFVVDDDEYDEEEERSRENRLAQVKKSGMDKYAKRSRYSDDEDEEEEEDADYGNDDDDEEEEIVVRRHKRNRIMSDEDE
ncbi:hypothetical protein HPULCUR_007770 [Helicostylum pulchrum]|uniref:Elongation factor 1 beta central acidic region eukaryote domain-containing protein n=1 Tax=Helicostylum pulchrum TaxID=562976 RepID=A0ABP9Y5P7_9FUNG